MRPKEASRCFDQNDDASFTLLAEVQKLPAKGESVAAKFRQMTEIVAGFPTEWDKDAPESVEVIRRFYAAWTKFKGDLLTD